MPLSIQTVTAQADQWGTVKGKITWGGKVIPKQEPIAAVMVNPDKMACMAGGNIVVDEKYVVNPKNKGLRYAFVWLEQANPANKAPLPINPYFKEIKDNKSCWISRFALSFRMRLPFEKARKSWPRTVRRLAII